MTNVPVVLWYPIAIEVLTKTTPPRRMSDTTLRNPDENIYSTRDLYLASTLITLKFFNVGIDYQIEGVKNQPIGYFKFEDTPALRDARQKYMQGLILVDPREFVQNMHMLKSEVQNMTLNPHNPVAA